MVGTGVGVVGGASIERERQGVLSEEELVQDKKAMDALWTYGLWVSKILCLY
jgi:hypothetical protein